LQRFAEPPVTLINTADRVPMPLRSIAWLCAVILVLLGGAARAAAPDGAGWQAVLAAGDIAEPVFDNAVAAFGQWLAARGVAPRDIHRLSARPFDPATEAASAAQLLRRIALLSPRPGERCLIFVTSHGEHGRGVHLAYSGERLTPAALAQALSAGCGTAPTVVIVSSCYSGSFAVGPMLAPNRIILTAARADRPSFGCQADRTYTVFDECLLAALPRSLRWQGVFETSLACVRQREREMGVLPSEPRHFFGERVRDLTVP
jgi:hypothetical protein